jgi:hypothetical protein
LVVNAKKSSPTVPEFFAQTLPLVVNAKKSSSIVPEFLALRFLSVSLAKKSGIWPEFVQVVFSAVVSQMTCAEAGELAAMANAARAQAQKTTRDRFAVTAGE